MEKYFNIAGPCNQSDHYMIDADIRLKEVQQLIEQKQYFVIHAARQSGKTTFLLDLVEKLNNSGKYYALYCSLEAAQGITDAEKGIPAILDNIKSSIKYSIVLKNTSIDVKYSEILLNYSVVLKDFISDLSVQLDKPLVILFDEADCLSEGTLISFLRQLRNGYNTRAQIPFVHSLALVGMRNIRDFKAKIRPDNETLGSASPFNIVSKSLTLRNFNEDEINFLYGQHTLATKQIFTTEAVQRAWHYTQGQPWLVNAIAREIIYEILGASNKSEITIELVDHAVQNIIMRRDTHIDSLLERLKEPRVQRIIEPVILGAEGQLDRLSDDYSYVKDLGLIRDDRNKTEPANPIYAEVIIRTLSYNTQENLRNAYAQYCLPHYIKNGKINMEYLLKDFQQFWRENSAIWADRFDYKEAAPHLILQAFLQRVLNGGGYILREMAAETRRLDLCVVFENHKYPIELKLRKSSKTYTEGLQQLNRYMDTLSCTEGWLIVFDRRKNISWNKKIFWKEDKVENNKITIVGC